MSNAQSSSCTAEDICRELREDDLNNSDCKDDGDIERVIEEPSEDVLLVIDLSRANHVEDLEEHEDCEDNCVMSGNSISVLERFPKRLSIESVLSTWLDVSVDLGLVSFFLRDEVLSLEDNEEDNKRHVHTHDPDMFGHLSRDDIVVPSLGSSFKEGWGRSFSGESERSEGIHDEVHP